MFDLVITILSLVFLLILLKVIFKFFRDALNEINYKKSAGPGTNNGGGFDKEGFFFADQKGISD